MSQSIRFYTDEHVPSAVIAGLRRRGVEVLTTPEAGMLGAADARHLELARSQRRIIITQDVDFLRLHASGVEHGGIVYGPQHTPVGRFLQGLMLIYEILDASEMQNHVEYL